MALYSSYIYQNPYGTLPPGSNAAATAAPAITTPQFAATTSGSKANPYNINPAPQTGAGTFGSVPGALGMPSPSGDLASQYPNLTSTNSALSSNILAELSGQLSPGTINFLQDRAAQYGVSSGMPGMAPGSLISQGNLRNLGLTSEALTQQGIRDYNATIPTVSGTQTVSPALQTQIAETNALNAAAPTPALAQNYAQQLYNQYLNAMRGPGTGTTGRPSPAAGIPTSTYQPSIPTSTGTSPYYSPQTGGQAGSGTGTGFLTDPSGNQWNANGTVTTPDGYNWTASDLSTFGTDLADVYGFNWGSGNAAQNTSNVGASSGSTYDSSYDPYAYDASSYDYGYDSSYDPYSEF